ncbi:hypothetical protein EEB15_30395 [Ramlibacter sp. WS9]|nr:hypothetical protein EEB15_30395 [Ramlibacter sp. WS9]
MCDYLSEGLTSCSTGPPPLRCHGNPCRPARSSRPPPCTWLCCGCCCSIRRCSRPCAMSLRSTCSRSARHPRRPWPPAAPSPFARPRSPRRPTTPRCSRGRRNPACP